MKRNIVKTLKGLISGVAFFSVMLLISCGNDNGSDDPQPGGPTVDFDIRSVSNSGISGKASFEKLENGDTRISITLTGTTPGESHKAHIHMNGKAESSVTTIDLTNVDGTTGSSVTDVIASRDGAVFTYEELVSYDGYLNIHKSGTDETVLAQGVLGLSTLTGTFVTYQLNEVDVPGISGTATFWERSNGQSVITVELTGETPDGERPFHLHENTAAESGKIVIVLNDVVGGFSTTDVSTLLDGTPITYEELIQFDGYLNVHGDFGLVAQADVGQNALTGGSVVYNLNEVSVPGVTGTATFRQRLNNETLVFIELTGDDNDGDYPSHIHANSATEKGGIVIILNNVRNSHAKTNVTALNNGTAITYDELLVFDGYINVHEETGDGLVAQGDIGSNVN